MRTKISVIFLILFFSFSIFSQEKARTAGEQTAKGKQIVEAARKEIGVDKLSSNLSAFHMLMKSQSDLGKIVIVTSKEISITLPDKVLVVNATSKPFESTISSIWNGEKYQKLSESVASNGQRNVQNLTNQQSSNSFSSFTKDRDVLEKIEKARAKDPKTERNDALWNEVFPLLLLHPFETEAEFNYVGKAESANGQADLVDTTTKDGRSIRLFFDSKTKLLLMMIEKYKFFDGDYENKYYYSNRELAGQVLTPKKIKVERRFTPTGKETKVTYTFIDVLELKINPKFKPNLFDVN